MVQMMGLEPIRAVARYPLKIVRLPFRHICLFLITYIILTSDKVIVKEKILKYDSRNSREPPSPVPVIQVRPFIATSIFVLRLPATESAPSSNLSMNLLLNYETLVVHI